LFFADHFRPVRWLVSGLVWAGWCWFIVREKHCWLAGLGWLKPTSEQAENSNKIQAALALKTRAEHILLMVYVLSLSVVAMDFAIPYHMKHKTGEIEKKVTNHTCGGCNTKTSVPHS